MVRNKGCKTHIGLVT